ncbi:DUF692 family multinuclear iron-containing protein [Aquabacterium sp.]|uniref:DUF692 domain-containing protein n=1 Tax=Aquabacterium sp. TaxID=1872578 RepID=UPI003784A3CE
MSTPGTLDAPPPLGIGLVYWQALEPLFAAGDQRLQVLELEPQTLWEQRHDGGAWHYHVNAGLLQRVAALPQAKLMHGVGHPLGGSCDDPLDWRTPWRHCAQALQPAWTSEHLSFNRFVDAQGRVAQTSFLLPPRQTAAGVAQAAQRLRQLRALSGTPVAFETGVNYLQPRPDELPDGRFFAQVAEAGDAGVLLDLHNLWVNARNGRAAVEQVLDELPLDRVWELHLAGGSLLDGYWLDAHDRLADQALLDIAAALIPRLPNLGALIFEILPQYVAGVGLDAIARQLDAMAALWALRPPRPVPAAQHRRQRAALRPMAPLAADARAALHDWERCLGPLALAQATAEDRAAVPGLADDPGCRIFEQLVREFRCGRIVRVMRYSLLAMLRALGPVEVDTLMRAYCRSCPSHLFTAIEADHFAHYLSGQLQAGALARVPWLAEVLAFEHAMVRAALHGEGCTLQWTVDPVRLFEALESGTGLDRLPPLPLQMQVQASQFSD